MSLNMYFVIDDVRYSHSLPHEVMNITKYLVDSGYGEYIAAMYDDTKNVRKDNLLKSIDFLIDSFEQEKEFMPYIYYVKYDRPRGSGQYNIVAGFTTGIMIKGERYTVEGGVEKCRLIKTWQDHDALWHESEPTDIRHKSVIKTDPEGDRGDLVIIKTKEPLYYVEKLKLIKSILLEAHNCDTVEKILPLE